ncbi:tetratricopeptide repeat protein [Neobacillus pocheonensis]|uniref:tetratricopeptide repeat protein n=1 Tax=Neobacillus pocheonensis TaxID=363869 RepID=UPI003D2DA2B6
MLWGTLSYGYSNVAEGKDQQSNLIVAQEYIKQENYEQAYQILREVEKDSTHPSEQVYFLLSFVEIKQRMLEDAQSHLLRAIQLNPKFTEAHYNLALVYLEENDFIKAKKYAEEAAKLNPDKKQYAELVKQINQLLQSSGHLE